MKLTQPAWPRALPTALIVNLATLGTLGERVRAPGTWGAAAGLLLFALFGGPLHAPEVVVTCAVAIWLAVGICGEAEVRLGRTDPGEVILDEFVVMPLCFLGWQRLPADLPWLVLLLAGFALFRFFDIVKPLGIKKLQDLPGGWGVVLDDVAAALAASVSLQLLGLVWHLL
jgi:phosphatidylglycerophosphatase A